MHESERERERERELHADEDALLTWIRTRVSPLERRWSVAHLRARWLPLSLSMATAIIPFPSVFFISFFFGCHIFFLPKKNKNLYFFLTTLHKLFKMTRNFKKQKDFLFKNLDNPFMC